MSNFRRRFEDYSREELESELDFVLGAAETVKRFVNETSDPSAVELLVEEEADKRYGRGPDSVRERILTADVTPFETKQKIFRRDADDLGETLVPDRVEQNARTALAVGKPVVLYGPTGTGKTHFAKQLLAEECLDYEIATATPTWTPGDITGSIQPELDDGDVEYRREPGCVSRGIQQAERYGKWGVLLDEITRADISQVFGPLYTAVEDDSQTIFVDDEGRELSLTDDVKIVCTMNMSDRTVNELDDAITRRFAMIELREYDAESRKDLYRSWMVSESGFGVSETDSNIVITNAPSDFDFDDDDLLDLFEAHHVGINEGTTTDRDEPITEFGPMHYRDVIQFISVACADGGAYAGNYARAVGEAFATYVAPRLLNTAALPQIRRLAEHYTTLDEEHPAFDLSPAIELVERQAETEQRGIGSGAYE
ncbi:AAA family ATPase [Halobaculum sp. MBLA0143]|uniref:AAA family ATPase n=1 Tax=Halobaculum sp. MBLA0143 TaxID=3079933 RepID=UPI003523F3BD